MEKPRMTWWLMLIVGPALACLPPEAQRVSFRAALRTLDISDQAALASMAEHIEETAAKACDPSSDLYGDRAIHIYHPAEQEGASPQALDSQMFEAVQALASGDDGRAARALGLCVHLAGDLAWPLQAKASLWEDAGGEGNKEGKGHQKTDGKAEGVAGRTDPRKLSADAPSGVGRPEPAEWAKKAEASYENFRSPKDEEIIAAVKEAAENQVSTLRWVLSAARLLAAQAYEQAGREAGRQPPSPAPTPSGAEKK